LPFNWLVSDITGFTAWCAEREPSQVFILLEHIFCAFDEIAKKRKVFKVETIGDCYMAAVGLPEPRDDHAVVICRFARQCILKLRGLLLDLEVILGPGTFVFGAT
jgi:class 3 adenylate cyclase